MNIEVDLNKLDLEELEKLIGIIRKGEKTEDIKLEDIDKDITEETFGKKTNEEQRKRKPVKKEKSIKLKEKLKRIREAILEKKIIWNKELRKIYGISGKQEPKVKEVLSRMHGILSARIGKRLYWFKKDFDIQKFAEKYGGTIRKMKGKRVMIKKSEIWDFKSKKLKELLKKGMPKAEAMRQMYKEWKIEKKKQEGFDYRKLDAQNPEVLKQIIETQLKKTKIINYRDVSSITTSMIWRFDIVPRMLTFGDEIIKDLGLKGRLINSGLDKIELQ